MHHSIAVLLILLLRCVNCKRYIVTDADSQTSRVVDTESPDYVAVPGVGYFPSSNDDGTYIEVYFGDPRVPGVPSSFMPPPGTHFAPESDSIFFPKDPRFYLYTKKNPSKPIQLYNNKDNSAAKGFFNPNAPVKIIAHGWTSDYTKPFPHDIKNEYTKETKSVDTNVILVDWKDLAANPVYIPSARNTQKVGKHTALLIEKLISEGFTDLKKIHFIGHSLGAHVGGATSEALKIEGKMARITGLDPAGYRFCPGQYRSLRQDDAEFVDVIHSSAGNYCVDDATDLLQIAEEKFGLGKHLGDTDFFPNGGAAQPGCEEPGTGMSCSHSRSHEYLTESVHSDIGFPGCKCHSWEDYENFQCDCPTHIPMGETCPPSADNGQYFLRTGRSAPFANVRNI